MEDKDEIKLDLEEQMNECRIKEVLLYGDYLMKKIKQLNEELLTPNQVREQLGLKKI